MKLSLHISLHMIHMVVESCKNAMQILSHVAPSPASMGLFSLETFVVAGLTQFGISQAMGLSTTTVLVHADLGWGAYSAR